MIKKQIDDVKMKFGFVAKRLNLVHRILIAKFMENTKVKIMKNAYKLMESENDYFKKVEI